MEISASAIRSATELESSRKNRQKAVARKHLGDHTIGSWLLQMEIYCSKLYQTEWKLIHVDGPATMMLPFLTLIANRS